MNKRAKNVIASLPADFEAALIQTPVSRFYLLDYDSGDAGTLLVLPDKMVYIIDSRYIESATERVKHAEVVLEEDALVQVAEILKKAGVTHLLLEDAISVALYEQTRGKLAGVELDVSPLLSKALMGRREIKDSVELARLHEAQRITDDCFTHILPFIKEGVREIDLMLEMEHYMRSHGAEQVAFDTICVTGANTSLPHGVPGEGRVQPGDFITMDFGARVGGYNADMTRTVAFGEPGAEKRKVYDMVLRAHLASMAAVLPGKKGFEVDKVARDIIYGEGYSGYFGHGLGHAVGIEVHENPRFSPKNTDEIKAGMMMTIEPGCYLPGRFGCRIEDMVLVTETGCEPFPTSNKQLIVL